MSIINKNNNNINKVDNSLNINQNHESIYCKVSNITKLLKKPKIEEIKPKN